MNNYPIGPDNLVFLEDGQNVVAIDNDRCRWVRTNDVGKRILELADGKTSLETITEKIAEEYDVPENLIENDISSFVKKGYEENIFIRDDEDFSPLHTLKTVWLNITNHCNLRCQYCYFDSGSSLPYEMSTEEMKHVISDLNTQNIRINVSGGEPLLREDLFDFIAHSTNYNCLISNGTVITEVISEDIEKHFKEVSLSLDGPDAETHEITRGKGTFNKTIHAMELLKERDFDLLGFSATVTKINFKKIPQMAELAFNMGVYLHLSQYVPLGRGKDNIYLPKKDYLDVVIQTYNHFNKLISESGETPPSYMDAAGAYFTEIFRSRPRENCGFGIGEMSIAPNGDVYPCPLLHVDNVKIGNILEQSIEDLHQQSVKTFSEINTSTIEGCATCHVRAYCGGGCRARALQKTGSIYGKDPYCDNYRFTIEYAMWHKGDPNQSLVRF